MLINAAPWVKVIMAILVAFGISICVTPTVKSFATKVGAIDVPDHKRHIHTHPIPRMGGLAIFFGFMLSALLLADITTEVRGILLGAIIIVATGAMDDVLSLKPGTKFLVQIIAAFGVSIAVTPAVKTFATRVGAVDVPDHKRHIHDHPIPRMGGLAIFLGFLVSVLFSPTSPPRYAAFSWAPF